MPESYYSIVITKVIDFFNDSTSNIYIIFIQFSFGLHVSSIQMIAINSLCFKEYY